MFFIPGVHKHDGGRPAHAVHAWVYKVRHFQGVLAGGIYMYLLAHSKCQLVDHGAELVPVLWGGAQQFLVVLAHA